MAQLKWSLDAGPAEALRLSQDDYSVRVASAADPIFWIRVERDRTDTVVVTDFNPGARPLGDLEVGLMMAVRAVLGPQPDVLMFKDLIPGGDQQQGFPVRLLRTADLAKSLANAVAASFGKVVTGFRLEQRAGGKLDAVLTIG